MSINITSTAGYLWLDSWIMANIIQLATQSFAKRFLNRTNDPCGRLFDQMTQAARSVQANIAEGSSRHQTSTETEMRLLDVARASLSELSSDYLNFLMSRGECAWSKERPEWSAIQSIRIDRPNYSQDLLHDVTAHILNQKRRFDSWIEANDPSIVANSLILLCGRLITILRKQISARLSHFKENGGFTENMSAERVATLKEKATSCDAPKCPECGKPMIKRTAKKGRNVGHEFYSCSDYPKCKGTKNID